MLWNDWPVVLAQEDEAVAPATPPDEVQEGQQPAEGEPGGAQPQQAPGGIDPFFMILMMLLVLMVVFMMFSGRKQKKQRQQMLDNLKKGDKIQTVGGIMGTIVDLREDELVVKVDENTNTRLHFARSSVQSVHSEDKDGEG